MARITRLLASVTLLGSSATVAGLGTFGTFTATTTATSGTLASGTVTIALGAGGASTNRLTVGASNLVPGDTLQRSFDLINTGSDNLASITLTTTATTSSLLNTDVTNGLQMVVDRCSVAWSESSNAGNAPYTYTCGGASATIISSTPVIVAGSAMAGLSALTAGQSDHLRVTLTFPSTAGNTFQGLSSVLQFAFNATQRAGTNE